MMLGKMYTLQKDEIRLLTGYTAFHIYNYFIVIEYLHCRRATVAHTCHTSFSGGRDQEDHGSKPAQAHILYCSLIAYKQCWEMGTFFSWQPEV
jgi:hypothetical protein